MTKSTKVQIDITKSKLEKVDIVTEMFEHFGIKVIDVGSQVPKTNKKKKS